MILEAFSQYLHQQWEAPGKSSAVDILHRWLLSHLSEAVPQDNVGKVLHTELEMLGDHCHVVFLPRSSTGETLLKSLTLYCQSYERWQFSRWLHHAKPQSFYGAS